LYFPRELLMSFLNMFKTNHLTIGMQILLMLLAYRQ
jgi:hypothetical protein